MTDTTLHKIEALAKQIATLAAQARVDENKETVKNLMHDIFGDLEDIMVQE